MWVWIIGGLVGVIALIAYTQHRGQSSTYRSLSSRQPTRRITAEKPLGMEATDLDAVNRATRRNESLERSQTSFTLFSGGRQASADTDIQPLADDETYAKRFHTAFLKDKD